METWFAADCSGSVGGKAGQRYFAELRAAKAAAPADVYLLWDDTLAVVTEPAMHAWLLEERGHGGTDPSVLARRIRQQAFHGVLRLFTDGSVPSDKVAACDALLHGAALERGERGHVFERVEVYIVETGSAADLSVALPFTRFSPYELKHVPKEGLPPPPQRVSAADQALFDAFLAAEPLDVEAAAARLKEVAEARFMGTRGSPQVRDAAIAAKNRLTAGMSARLGADFGEELVPLLEGGRLAEACDVGRRLVRAFREVRDDTPGTRALDAIIGLCDGLARKCFTKEEARRALSRPAERAALAPAPAEPLPLDEGALDAPSAWFVCPVTLEESTDNLVLLLTAPEGGGCFLDGLDADFQQLLSRNPLWLWTRPAAVEGFAALLDDVLSCGALRAAREAGTPLRASPTTRRPLVAAFPLATASAAHAAARRWALLRAVAGGRRRGNPELWFLNLALVVSRGKVPARLQQALPLILAALRAQLLGSSTYASLSGLPELPMARVPCAAALWLVAAGPAYDFPQMLLPLLPLLAELRWAVEDVLGYRLPAACPQAWGRLQVVRSMHAWKKGAAPSEAAPFSPGEPKRRLPNLMGALVQHAWQLPLAACAAARERLPPGWAVEEFVLLDGPADAAQRARVLALLPGAYRAHALAYGWQELVTLEGYADVAKGLGECLPPCELPALDARATVAWAYGLQPYPRCIVPLCPATARPYSRLGIEPWQQVAEAFYGFAPEPHLTLSAHEHYGRFVQERGLYPTPAELALCLQQRWVASGKARTLPHLLQQFLEEVEESAAPLVEALAAPEFGARFVRSRRLADRRVLEEAAKPRVA